MEQLFTEMKNWMLAYMKSFYNDDTNIQRAILLKEEHTLKVLAISGELAAALQLNEHDTWLAKMLGLFHDIGRFHQFTVYQTFNDAHSLDHGNLGADYLAGLPFFQQLSPADQDVMLFAIRNHNKKDIAPGSPRQVFFAKVLRDSDKLDIYRVLLPFLTPSDGKGFAPGFLAKFISGEQCDYTKIKTMDDRKLVRLMWVYDLNFSWTMQKVAERGYVEKIIKELPPSQEIKQGCAKLKQYIAAKLQEKLPQGAPQE